jgi:histidyl-tRNA synthetase
MGEAARIAATKLCRRLRDEGFSAITDVTGRSVKAQMKYADKIGAKFSVILGDNELAEKKCVFKNMENGEQKEVEIPDGIAKALYDSFFDSFADSFGDLDNDIKL